MLTFDLRLRRKDFELNCQASLPRGVTGLFGPSGSGKSTLLHCLAGLVRPTQGQIELDGRSIYDSATKKWIPPHRRSIGVVFQDGRLFPHMSVRGNMLYGLRMVPIAQRRFQLGEIADLLELERLLDRSVGGLSGGERQRVALGRALLASPRLLLLDEPLANLDRRIKAEILPFLRRIQSNTNLPMLYVSHDLEEVAYLCDHIMLMDKGRLISRGKFDTLIHDPVAIKKLGPGGEINVFDAKVCHHDQEMGWTMLEAAIPGTSDTSKAVYLKCAGQPHLALGEQVRVIIRPQDIALASSRVDGISMQNQWMSQVDRLFPMGDRVLCRVNAGLPLLVEVTPQSVAELGLAEGQPVVCLFKTHGVRLLGSDTIEHTQAFTEEPSAHNEDLMQQTG